ncbi:MAG: hypothetical protein WBD40_14175 [Tepidisphaeraceae bacterium]
MSLLPAKTTCSPLGHSADVTLLLHVASGTIPLAQTSDAALKLKHDTHITFGPAKVEIVVDGVSHFTDVTITARRPNSLWLDLA